MDISSNNLEFNINRSRFNYLLELFNISKEELIARIHEGKKREIINIEKLNKILDGEEKINIETLKKIDDIFKQGLSWYITKRDLPNIKESSIFFRKDSFNSELNLESRKKVKQYEELKFEIRTLCNQINYNNTILIKNYSSSDNPEHIAKNMGEKFREIENQLLENKKIKKAIDDDKEYLKNLIRIIEEMNIFVFEFTENWNKKEKVNFDGFFISPNTIVIKRQKYLRREIFTLMHEFAHCLLNSEEIDEIDENNNYSKPNSAESWCHDFTYFFLLGEHKIEYDKLSKANSNNNYYENEIKQLYDKTHLSITSFYTRLKIENKISLSDYKSITEKIYQSIHQKEIEEKMIREDEKRIAKEQGKKIIVIQKPIESNLFSDIVKINYFQGNIDESKLRRFLKIKPNIRIEEVTF